MVILDTSFSCIKMPIENYSWFLFFTSHKNTNQSSILIPINHQSYYLLYFVMQAVTFRFFVYLLSNI